MAALAPYGLRSLYSHSNSSLAQSGVEEFPFPTTGGWYGFAGDVACLNFYVASVPADPFNNYVPQAPTGYVYPYPTVRQNNTVYAPVIGVFEGFKYTPLGQPGYIKESTNFIPGTLIQPGTQVMAVVRVDMQGVYQVQAGRSDGQGVVERPYILTKSYLSALAYYQVTLPDVPNSPTPNPVNALLFPMGNTGENGMSSLYFDSDNNLPFQSNGLGITYPFRLIGCVNPDDYTTSSKTVYNPQVKVRIDAINAQSFAIVQPLTS